MAIYQPKVKPQLQKPKPHLPRTEFSFHVASVSSFGFVDSVLFSYEGKALVLAGAGPMIF